MVTDVQEIEESQPVHRLLQLLIIVLVRIVDRIDNLIIALA